jgi:thioredoxin 1
MIKILKFSSSWCQPCRVLKTYLPEVIQKTGVELISLDADDHEREFERYSVRSVPTLIFLQNELEIGRKTGLIQKDELIRLIEEYQTNHSK